MCKKILLVEGDLGFSELARIWMQDAGFEVYTAGDGTEGMQQIYSCRPDVVILDMNLREMDVWEVCRHIRDRSNIPVLLMRIEDNTDQLNGFIPGLFEMIKSV